MRKINKQPTAYIIRALSPLHAGSGDANYGVVDKLLQRDPVNNYPVIHASGLKGALREYMEYQLEHGSPAFAAKAKAYVNKIFGYGNKSSRDEEQEQGGKHQAGLFDFDQGFLLSLPVRTDKAAFISATSPEAIQGFLERLRLFGVPGREKAEALLAPLTALNPSKPLVFETRLDNAILEEPDFKASYHALDADMPALAALLGPRPALLPDKHFSFLAENLPVIARNHLENGESKNLWYEEVAPRESRFYAIITAATWSNGEKQEEHSLATVFSQAVQASLVQVGANATVGYGKTQFSALEQLIK